jgi:hypothetical protein
VLCERRDEPPRVIKRQPAAKLEEIIEPKSSGKLCAAHPRQRRPVRVFFAGRRILVVHAPHSYCRSATSTSDKSRCRHTFGCAFGAASRRSRMHAPSAARLAVQGSVAPACNVLLRGTRCCGRFGLRSFAGEFVPGGAPAARRLNGLATYMALHLPCATISCQIHPTPPTVKDGSS